MKITNVTPYVVAAEMPGVPEENWAWTFVVIETDEGVTGFGESTNWPGGGSFLAADAVVRMRDLLIGEDPADIERLWHKMYRAYTYLGARGLPTTAISGIDIALWDIKGKALGRPVYDLLGGRMRDNVRLYANAWFTGCSTPEQYADAASRTVADGHDALKLDPFLEKAFANFSNGGRISADGEELAYDIIAAVRETVGPKVEVLIDAHGNFDVPTAVRLSRNLYERYKIGWFEEPVPPEGWDALRSVREQTPAPICVGERLFTRWDFVPALDGGLTDYIMPDIVWTGGISEMKKIATLAESRFVPISPHNAMGSYQIVAGINVMMTVPNFYRLEHCVSFIPTYNSFLEEPIRFDGNKASVSGKPGLGHDLDMDYVRGHLHPQAAGHI
jgi:galactonate dehydratase